MQRARRIKSAPRAAENVHNVYSGEFSAILEVGTELGDTNGACWDDSETCDEVTL